MSASYTYSRLVREFRADRLHTRVLVSLARRVAAEGMPLWVSMQAYEEAMAPFVDAWPPDDRPVAWEVVDAGRARLGPLYLPPPSTGPRIGPSGRRQPDWANHKYPPFGSVRCLPRGAWTLAAQAWLRAEVREREAYRRLDRVTPPPPPDDAEDRGERGDGGDAGPATPVDPADCTPQGSQRGGGLAARQP